MKYFVILASVLAVPAYAQQADYSRSAAAIPALVEQRNNALDGLALCQGDLGTVQKKLKQAEEALKDKDKPKDGQK